MFKNLTKQKLQDNDTNNKTTKNAIEEQSDFEITISSENNISKIVISDYITIGDYVKKIESSDEFHLLDSLCISVLWNSGKQKINKGIFYVISKANRLYNISFTDEEIKIDERTKIEFDEQEQKENITEERIITFDITTNEYRYFGAKHDKTGSTYHTRYYNKNRLYSLGPLDLSAEETYNEIRLVIYNLESINGIENIIDIKMFKKQILGDLSKDLVQIKKYNKNRR